MFSEESLRGCKLVAPDYLVLALLTIGVSAILIGTGLTLTSARTDEQANLAVPSNSLAVFPFENLSDDSAHNYIGYGVAVDIVNKLANLKEL